MKTSYLLLGSPWDGLAVPEVLPAHLPFDESVVEVGEQDCLFDLRRRRRFIRISRLLSCNTKEEVDAAIAPLSGCQFVHLLLDFSLKSGNKVLTSFYRLRCLQIAHYFSEELEDVSVSFMESPSELLLHAPRKLTLPWLIKIAERYESILVEKGMDFNEDGFPLIPDEHYAKRIPADMVDYAHRHSKLVADSSSTAICFFMGDARIYPRFEYLLRDACEFERFAAVVMPDLTVTADMDLPWQAFIMLLNQLYAAVVSVCGVKIIANTRCGSPESRRYLRAIPRGVLCASGSLGCDRLVEPYDYSYAEKILRMRPSALLSYGKRDVITNEQLTAMGIDVVSYPDTHSKSKARSLALKSAA